MTSLRCPFLTTVLALISLAAGPRFLVAQSLSSYTGSLTATIDSLTSQYQATASTHVAMSANLYLANGGIVAGVSTQTLLDYVDGLKAAGAQRIDLNPGLTTVTNSSTAAKYDAVVQHIRALGLQLAINPEFTTGETNISSFQEFQTQAASAYQQLAARYQPDYFVIIHEPTTMAGRMGLQTTVADWDGFVTALAPVIKTASPRTLVGAGDYYGARPEGEGNSTEAAYYADFVANTSLDFTTMDIYTADPASIAQFVSWAQMAHANKKFVYIEETARPQFLPTILPANWASQSNEQMAIDGSGFLPFAPLDAAWITMMTYFAAANGMVAVTYFQTNTFFYYTSGAVNKATSSGYIEQMMTAVTQGPLTSTGAAFLSMSQKSGIAEVTSLSNASYATISSPIYNPNCGTATDPCNANTMVAPGQWVSAYGADLGTQSAVSLNFPTSLGGTSITLLDSTNVSYDVQLYSVSKNQVNYLVPSKAASGPATLTVTSGDGVKSTGIVYVQPVAPGLYTANANGQGAAAAIAICAGTCAGYPYKLSNGQSWEYTAAQPIGLAAGDAVVVELYGTGIRNVSSTSAVNATINGQALQVSYAGAQSSDLGLDQINVQLPNSLAGSGVVSLVMTVDGLPVNTVTLDIE